MSLIRGVLKKSCVAQPFSTRDTTMALKQRAHVTEGILRAHAKFCSNRLKIT